MQNGVSRGSFLPIYVLPVQLLKAFSGYKKQRKMQEKLKRVYLYFPFDE